MKRFREGKLNAAVRACALLSALLLPAPTVCVTPLLTYWVAPTEGKISQAEAGTLARGLQKEIGKKLADSSRVQETTEIFRRVTNCRKYPCEILVEEVNIIDNVYSFELESKFYERPSDRPQPDHQGIDPWPCPTTPDLSAEDCFRQAPEKLAAALKAHDETYHPRNQ